MVERFTITAAEQDPWIDADPSGQWVLYSDYAALEAKNERLRKALDRLLGPFKGDECRKDHHGCCQAHFLEEDCCVAVARLALEGGK